MPDVVVVGGGIAGLVAARDLAEGGLSVMLLESSNRLGGSLARHTVGGIVLDAGAESFATRGGHVEKLAADIGLGDQIVRPNPSGAWLYEADRATVPIPKHTLLGIPGSPLARDVVDVVGGRAAFRAFLEIAFPGAYGANSHTIGELVRKRMGSAVVDRLVAPITRGVYSVNADDLDLDRAAPELRSALRRTGSLARAVLDLAPSDRAGSNVAGIRGGVMRLVDELTADLERFAVDVQLNTRVTSVREDSARVGRAAVKGRVVVATSALFDSEPPTQRVVLVTLVVGEPRLDAAPRGTGVLVADGVAGIRARALTHATAKWEWLAERAVGRHVLRLSYTAVEGNVATVALTDASQLLGIELDPASVVDVARVDWDRRQIGIRAAGGPVVVGEAAAGTGLAAVVAQARAQAGSLLKELAP